MDEDYEEFLSYAEAAGNADLGNMTVSWFFNFLVLRSDPISRRPFFLENPYCFHSNPDPLSGSDSV